MRDIEIRAWYRGKMYYHVEYTTYEDGSGGVTGLMSRDERPFAPTDSGIKGMLYIGLSDISGKDIYEGDIVEWRDDIFVVRYARHLAQFALYQHVSEKAGRNKEWRYEDSMSDIEQYKVIGNIYETPELIRKEI